MTLRSKAPEGKRLFSFVVVADTHINETDDSSRSPFASNAKANDRARFVFSQIAGLEPKPQFIVHLGDIVHPVPSLPGFDDAARRYHRIADTVTVPVHLVPGNHDVGDKTIDWMPADIVCDAYLDKYRQTFGADYYAVDAGPLKLLVVNALLFNSGLAGEDQQKQWLDAQLAAGSQRVYVFIHYPPFLVDEHERSSYDNIDQPGRQWLIERLRHPSVEAVFAGHVHNFWYDVVGSAEMYMLPSTAFLRHDFSELYRVAPGAEFGRDDGEKFGYFIVDVHDKGHVARLVRTGGQTLADGVTMAPPRSVRPTHTKVSALSRFGVELRHPWAEIVPIPSTGGVQEFGRKPARNDYQLMALWEMGVRTLKIPLQDFDDPATLRRGRLMSDVGHDFVLTSLGLADPAAIERIVDAGVAISAVEVNLSLAKAAARITRLQALRSTGVPVMLSHLRTSEESHFDGKHFSHFVNAGLRIEELPLRQQQIAALIDAVAIDGVTVRLDWGGDVFAAAQAADAWANATGAKVLVSVKLGSHSLAVANHDDGAIAALAAETVVMSLCCTPHLRFVFDTFMDVDRGYFPRNGFIDRRFNPRAANRAVAGLCSAFEKNIDAARLIRQERIGSGRLIEFEVGGEGYALLSAHRDALTDLDASSWRGYSCRVDLRTLDTGALPLKALAESAHSDGAVLALLSKTA